MWVVYLGDRLQIFCATNTTQARFRGHRFPHRGLSGRGNRVGHWCCACRECSADNCFLRWLLAVSRQTGANKILRYTQIKHRHGIPTEQESISRCDENVGLTFPEPNRTFRTGGVQKPRAFGGDKLLKPNNMPTQRLSSKTAATSFPLEHQAQPSPRPSVLNDDTAHTRHTLCFFFREHASRSIHFSAGFDSTSRRFSQLLTLFTGERICHLRPHCSPKRTTSRTSNYELLPALREPSVFS